MEMHTCARQSCHVIVTCRTNVFPLKGLCVYSSIQSASWMPEAGKFTSIYIYVCVCIYIYMNVPRFHSILYMIHFR